MDNTIAQFVAAFEAAFAQGTLLKCTLGKRIGSEHPDLKNIFIRPVSLKKGLFLAFNWRYATKDEVKNYPLETAKSQLLDLLGTQFLNADLFTSQADWHLQINAQGQAKLNTKKPAQPTAAPTLSHDRDKQRLLDPTAPWLHALGITNTQGTVLANAQDKWRQINKYLETIDALLREHPLPNDAHIADMGSGKGYLTFALYDFLHNRLGLAPQITGIELRQPLVEFCQQTAAACGFEGLHFKALDIAQYHPPRLDMLIALHACDTATDLALFTGIQQKAGIIVAAPCCHKQVRRDMTAQNEMAPLLKFGILEERQAEILTDGIRALLLEANGYATKVFEFISTEHTPKNVMITAQRQKNNPPNKRQAALEKVAALKQGFGIKKHQLESMLNAKC